ncbi:MAG: pentapeptide repeat-containing protein [Mucilaginibacter sp.]|nr:pentapeptide repeat-containing protein [Mucilaginibacter sp.]
MEVIEINKTTKQLIVNEAVIDNGRITTACINGMQMYDVAATNVLIDNANLSDLEIKNAQLGGAYIHNIGLPPASHPYYDPNAEQRPLRFDDCDLHGSSITNCNLSNVSISNCNLIGMTIDGIPVEDLLKVYKR